MIVYRSLQDVPIPAPPGAFAIGNFDGLHLGHRRIIARLKKEAAERRLPAGVLTFSPHPEKVFGPARLCMLQTLDQRIQGLLEWGVEVVAVVPFSRSFARMPGVEFARDILGAALNARLVVVGADFKFGRDREYGVADLRSWGRKAGCAVRAVPDVKRRGRIVRSSRIRDFITSGRVDAAARLLGRPYAIEGDIVGGDRRGRRLGFPTANILSPNELLPRGVYLTRLEWDGLLHASVTSIGVRPTFRRHVLTVETHILDFEGSLYGRSVRLWFLRKLRDEMRCSGPAALRTRIEQDVREARRYFRLDRRV